MLRVNDLVKYPVMGFLTGGMVVGMTHEQYDELVDILQKNEMDKMFDKCKEVEEALVTGKRKFPLFEKSYTPEMEKWLLKVKNIHDEYESYQEFCDAFNKKFGTDKSISAIKTKYLRLKQENKK